MEFSKFQVEERGQFNKYILPKPLDPPKNIIPRPMFESMMQLVRVEKETLDEFFTAYEYDYFGMKKWKAAGFCKTRYEDLLDAMGRDWRNDFREVLEYSVNYAIWSAEAYLEKTRVKTDECKDKAISEAVLGHVPSPIRAACEFIHRSWDPKKICRRCGLLKTKKPAN